MIFLQGTLEDLCRAPPLCLKPQRSLRRAPTLSVSGPGVFPLSLSGPGALCLGARRSSDALCVAAWRSLCQGLALFLCQGPALSVSGPGRFCVGARRALCRGPHPRATYPVRGPQLSPAPWARQGSTRHLSSPRAPFRVPPIRSCRPRPRIRVPPILGGGLGRLKRGKVCGPGSTFLNPQKEEIRTSCPYHCSPHGHAQIRVPSICGPPAPIRVPPIRSCGPSSDPRATHPVTPQLRSVPPTSPQLRSAFRYFRREPFGGIDEITNTYYTFLHYFR